MIRQRLYLFIYTLLLTIPMMAQRPQYAKMSPRLRHVAKTLRAPAQLPTKGKMYIAAFVRITEDADEVLARNGCQSLAKAGNIHIANIPVDRLAQLSQDSRVKRIEANWGNQLQLDTVARCVNAEAIYQGQQLPQAYTGKGIVMGLMDVGFDLTHPTFYSRDTTEYRISRLWDMLSQDTIGSQLYVGRDYTTREELLALGCCRDGYEQKHGTHTAGIAAGSGYNSDYRGLAYESELCLVANAVSDDVALIDSADLYKYTFATDALGFKYIFDYADAVGKPCVISFSEGSPQDFWGYDQLYYEMLDSLVGPGHILVVAAGNEGRKKSWFRKPKGKPSGGTFIYGWQNTITTFKSTDEFTLRLVSYNEVQNDTILFKTKDILAAEDSTLSAVSHTDDDNVLAIQIEAYPSCYIEQETCYDLYLISKGTIGYTTHPLSVEVIGEDADVEVYRSSGTFTTNELNPELSDGEYDRNILSPGSAPCAICVGNNSYRPAFMNHVGERISVDSVTNGYISIHSSRGPTYDGRMKPDVVAPGNNIVSSLSSFYLEKHPDSGSGSWLTQFFAFNNRTYPWGGDSGTSMSAPAVAGVIALWLEAKPDLTREEIMGVLERTCIHPDPTLTYPNNIYGYGQIDAYAGLLDILKLNEIEAISNYQTPARFSLSDGRLHISIGTPATAPLRLRIYSLNGKCLADRSLPANQTSYTIMLPALAHAVYAVQLDGDPALRGSSLIRY